MKLEIDSVNLKFGEKEILSDVYFTSETGQITGLLGRNGCGKSSLFKIVLGVLKSDYASVRVDKIYLKSPFQSKKIKYLPQTFIIPNSLTISKAIYFFDADYWICKRIFEEKGIKLNSHFEDLSGGQRRLAEIIIFLYSPSPFIILDEPFTHISPLQVEELKGILKDAKQYKGIIISDHQYQHVIDITDELYLLKNAKTFHLKKGKYMEQLKDFMYIL